MIGRFPGLRQAGLRRAADPGSESSGSGVGGVGGSSTSSLTTIIETRAQALTGVAGLTFWHEPFVVRPGTRGSYWRDIHATDNQINNSVPGGVVQVFSNGGFGVILVDPNDGYPYDAGRPPSIMGEISAAAPFYLFTRFRLRSDPGSGGPGGWDVGHNAFVIGLVDPTTLGVVGVGIAQGSDGFFGAVGGHVQDGVSTTGISSLVARDFDLWHVIELYTVDGKFWLKVDNGSPIDVSAIFPGTAVHGTPFVQVIAADVLQAAVDVDHIAYGAGRNGAVLAPLGPDPGGVSGVTATAPLVSSGGAAPNISWPTLGAAGKTVAESATAAAIRTALALVPGTDVQAYDADLAALAAGITAEGLNLVLTSGVPGQQQALHLEPGVDIPSKAYVDGLFAGLKWKATVKVATTAAGTLATSFENGDTVDGVVLATGDRILVKNQAAGAENGLYVVAASGAPARSTDADAGAELVGAAVFVEQGTANADKAFVCTNNAIVLGSTAITFTAFASVVGALIASNNLSDLASAATARTNLGLAIGSNVQAWDADLDTLAGAITASGHAMAAAASTAAQAALLGSAIPVQGTALTDADQTLTVGGGNLYTQSTALTANRVKTLGTGGTPITGEVITIIRLDTAAFTLTVKDDAAVTLVVLPASTKCIVSCRWNGTHFADPSVQRVT